MRISGQRRTKSMRVYDRLFRHITSPELAPGERLASMPRLAKLFETSVFTIQQAIRDLEAKGYVVTKNGSGTFVASCHRPLTMADTVMVCMEAHGHLYPELSAEIMDALSEHGRIGALIDINKGSNEEDMARRIAHSESRTMIVHAGAHFPFRIFDLPGMKSKTVISVMSWTSPSRWSGLHRIIHDRDEGARLVAEHLMARGHRKVLLLGTASQIYLLTNDSPDDSTPSWPFSREWERLGGRWIAQESLVKEYLDMRLDEDAFLGVFDMADPPTAVFGLRDHEAWLAQDLLLRRRPGLAGKIEIVGYGNTPWSQAGHPPFSTVDFNFPDMVAETMKIICRQDDEDAMEDFCVQIKPRLIVR